MRESRSVRTYKGWLYAVVLLGTLLIGCQGAMLSPTGGRVPLAQAIPVSQGQHSGGWETRDLAVDYQYILDGNNLRIAGVTHFADYMRINFRQIERFHMGMLFLDNQGKVIGSTPITTGYPYMDPERPLEFAETINLPSGTDAVVFRYTGEAVSFDSADGGISQPFWYYPGR